MISFVIGYIGLATVTIGLGVFLWRWRLESQRLALRRAVGADMAHHLEFLRAHGRGYSPEQLRRRRAHLEAHEAGLRAAVERRALGQRLAADLDHHHQQLLERHQRGYSPDQLRRHRDHLRDHLKESP